MKSCNPATETTSLEAIWWACSSAMPDLKQKQILVFVQVTIMTCALLMQLYETEKSRHKVPLYWHILPLLFLLPPSPALSLVSSCACRDCRAPCGCDSYGHHMPPLLRLPAARFPLETSVPGVSHSYAIGPAVPDQHMMLKSAHPKYLGLIPMLENSASTSTGTGIHSVTAFGSLWT